MLADVADFGAPAALDDRPLCFAWPAKHVLLTSEAGLPTRRGQLV